MKRLLVITYGFPPVNMIGVVRVAKFVKYIARAGWESLVVTPRNLPYYPRDPALLADLPSTVSVFPTAYAEPQLLVPARFRDSAAKQSGSSPTAALGRTAAFAGRMFQAAIRFAFVPDQMTLWPRLAWRTASQVVRTFSPDAMFSTAPPASSHLLALRLKRTFGLPWVADFRDEWTKNPFTEYSTKLHERLNRRLERRVLETCDRLTSISEPLVESFRDALPAEEHAKCSVLYNGYDEEDFSGPPPPLAERFTITYTGNFYGHRQPTTFFRALERIVRDGTIPINDLRVVFAGTNVFRRDPTIDMGTVERVLELRPTVPHREAIDLMRRSSAVLLVISGQSGQGSLTGKLFEYLASGRPILALVPPHGAAAAIIRELDAGIVVDPDDPEAVVTAVTRLYRQWKSGSLHRRSTPKLTEFSRERQSQRLLQLLDGLPRPTYA